MERLRKPRDTTAKLAPTRRRVALAAVLALLTLGWPDLASPARARSVGGNAVRQQVDVSGHAALRVTAKAKRCAATLTVSVGGRRAASGRVTRHRRTLTAARLLGPGRHTVELRGRRGCALDVTRVTARAVWVPAPGTSWQWQLSGPLDPSVEAAMYDLDLFDTPASTVAALHAQGRRVV